MQFKLIALATLSIVVSLGLASPAVSARQDDPPSFCDIESATACCDSIDGDTGVNCAVFDPLSGETCPQIAACCDGIDGTVGTGCVEPDAGN